MARRKFSTTGEGDLLLRRFLKTFFAPFRAPPTDCPWVSEDVSSVEDMMPIFRSRESHKVACYWSALSVQDIGSSS